MFVRPFVVLLFVVDARGRAALTVLTHSQTPASGRGLAEQSSEIKV